MIQYKVRSCDQSISDWVAVEYGLIHTLPSQVEVVTSDLRGAGTEANVHMIMHGTLGDGQRHLLTNGHDDFNRCFRWIEL